MLIILVLYIPVLKVIEMNSMYKIGFILSVLFVPFIKSRMIDPLLHQSTQTNMIESVSEIEWKSIVTHDPVESFVSQIQERENDKREEPDHKIFRGFRFTKLCVNNLIFAIDSDQKVPTYDSNFTLMVFIKNGVGKPEQITFKLLNGNEFYTSEFNGVSEVDKFLSGVDKQNQIFYEKAMVEKYLFDAKVSWAIGPLDRWTNGLLKKYEDTY
jgi:hypothetical protein